MSCQVSRRDAHAWDWNAFDPLSYLAHNYATVLPPDAWLFERTIDDLAAAAEGKQPNRRHADVGTGPNLYPVFAALPHATTIDVLEVGAGNRRYLLEQLVRIEPTWDPWRRFAAQRGVTIEQQVFSRALRLGAAGIFDLPDDEYHSMTSFFCAESITDDVEEFSVACTRLVAGLRADGHLSAAFMLGSTGYDTPGREFPAVPIEIPDLTAIFAPLLSDLRVVQVPDGSGVRDGYSGMAYLSGTRR